MTPTRRPPAHALLVSAGVGTLAAYGKPGDVLDFFELDPLVVELARRRFDFLRGNEPYKYEWGAVDERIDRIIVVRGRG